MYIKLTDVWAMIQETSTLRKTKLEESFQYHKFLVHYRDLAMELERLDGVCSEGHEARDLAEAALFVDQHVHFKVWVAIMSLIMSLNIY